MYKLVKSIIVKKLLPQKQIFSPEIYLTLNVNPEKMLLKSNQNSNVGPTQRTNEHSFRGCNKFSLSLSIVPVPLATEKNVTP